MRDNVDQLIERYVDDRESLSDEELEALVEAVRESEELACELKNQLLIEELIAQRISLDRTNFLAQVQQRMADLNLGADALDKQVAELRELASAQYEQWTSAAQRKPRVRGRWLAVAAALLLLVVGAVGGGLYFTQDWNSLAVVESAEGGVLRIRDGRTETISSFDRVQKGDRLRTQSDGHALIRYHDGTTIDITADSLVEFQTDVRTTGKRVFVEHGAMTADVVKQPSQQRMTVGTLAADATVVGTRFLVSADARQSRIDVFEGVVDVVRNSDLAQKRVEAQNYAVISDEEMRVGRIGWPSDERGLVFVSSDYQPKLLTDPVTGEQRQCRVVARRQAQPNHDYAMVLNGGFYEATNETAQTVLDACRQSGEFSLEAIVQTDGLVQDGAPRIIAFGDDAYEYNFALVQDGGKLALRLKTTTPANGKATLQQVSLCRLEDTHPHHLAVTYHDAQLIGYLDGEKVFETASVTGDLHDWTSQHLTLGDEWQGGHDWSGTLEGVAIYNRVLPPSETRRNAEYYLQLISLRDPVPQIEIEAELVAHSAIPPMGSTNLSQPMVSKYRVVNVLRGEYSDPEILVIEWAYLNGEAQAAAEAKPGDRVRLVLEHIDYNPQIGHANAKTANDFEHPDQRPHYFAVRRTEE